MASSRMAGRNLALLLVLGVIWGTAFMFISLGLPRFSPVLFAAIRFDIAGAVLLGIALWRRVPLRPTGRAQWIAIAVAAVLNVGMYHALLFWGQRFTTAAIAAVLVGLNPVLTTVFSRALLEDERVGWGGAVGLVLGVLGVAALAGLGPGTIVGHFREATGVGELVIVGAVASWSVGSILVKRTRHGMHVLAFTSWHMLAGAALLHVGALAFEGGGSARWDLPGTLSMLYLAVVSSSLGFLLYFTLLERVGPIRSNLVSHIAPVFAALAGVLVLAEAIELRGAVAFVLIATGFALVARKAPPRAAARSASP